MSRKRIKSSIAFLMAMILSAMVPLAAVAETAEPGTTAFSLFGEVETFEEELRSLVDGGVAAVAEESVEESAGETVRAGAAETSGDVSLLHAPAQGNGRDITETIYWAVSDGTLMLGSRAINGVVAGSINGRRRYGPDEKEEYRNLPWEEYKEDITSVVVGAPFDPVTASPTDYVVPSNYTTYWFHGLERLKSVNLAGLDTSYVKDFSYMFDGCAELTDAADAGLLDMRLAETMQGMFRGCMRLPEIDLSHLNTANVKDMSDLFLNCSDLETVTLGELDTSAVETMAGMFDGCESLREADITKLNTSKVFSFEGMFRNCRSLEVIDLANFGMDVATDLNEMFLNCENVRVLDLSGEHITSQYAEEAMKNMFTGCLRLEKVKVNVDFRLSWTGLPDPSETYIPGTEGWWYSEKDGSAHKGKEFEDGADTYDAVFDYYTAIWQKADGTVLASMSHVPHPKSKDFVPEYPGAIPTEESTTEGKKYVFTGWESKNMSGKMVCYTARFELRDAENSILVRWLNYDGTELDTSYVTYGHSPVYGGDDPVRPKEGKSTFAFAGWKPEIGPAWKDETYTAVFTEKIDDGVYWGFDASDKKLYLSCGETAHIATASDSGQFSGSTVFATASEVPWARYAGRVTAVVTEQSGGSKAVPQSLAFWFAGMKDLQQISLAGIDVSGAASLRNMFAGCSMLQTIDGTALAVSEKATDLSGMFRDCTRLNGIPGFAPVTDNVESFADMFSGCSYLKSLDVSGFRTGKAKDLSGMFRGCVRLPVISLGGFDTGNAEDMREMLSGCRLVTVFDFTGFDTTKCAGKMTGMLEGCTSLGGFTTGAKCVFSKDTGLPAPSPALYGGADGTYWFDENNDGFTPDKVHAGGTYRPVYGQLTYAINYKGRTDTVVVQLRFGATVYGIKANPFFVAEDIGFVSWNTEPDGTGISYKANVPVYKADGGIRALLGKTLYARWEKIIVNTAKITWRNTDEAQTVLQLDEAVPYGETPVYAGKTPVRDPDGYYTYTFDRWEDADGNGPQPASKDTTYFAKYQTTDRYYDVVWYNFDGTVMRRDPQLIAGTLPVYRGITPLKSEDYEYTYVFRGWEDENGHEPTYLVANKNYVAQYDAIPKKHDAKYEVQWLDFDNTVLKKETVPEGTVPKYDGKPQRPSTKEYEYSFKGWDPVPEKIERNMIFKAQYSVFDRMYTVWYDSNGHGTNPESVQLKPGDSIPKPETPTAEGYDFVGWCLKNDGSQPFDFNNETMPYADLMLYASWKKHQSGGGGESGGGGGGGTAGRVTTMAINKGATYAKYWFRNATGDWMINDARGNLITSAWLCDDLVSVNRPAIWYLIGEDGRMLDAGLVQDNTGNYYSLEMRHNGYYGMLRYQSGVYDGIWLEFETDHNGSFGAIKNQDGIDALKAKYGVTRYYIGNERCLYTSDFE